jgi:hypothetical protein
MGNLFIGLGGAGIKTLRHLRAQNRKDFNGRSLDNFLFIDNIDNVLF